MASEEHKAPFCGVQNHAIDDDPDHVWADEAGCIACQDDAKEKARKAAYDAHVKQFAPAARKFLGTEGLTRTEAYRAYHRLRMAKRRAAKPEYDRELQAKYSAMGLAPDQAFISATPAHLKFGLYAALTSHVAVWKASGGALSLDYIFPRNRLKDDPPALGLNIPANLRFVLGEKNKSRKNRITRTQHREGLMAGTGALLDEFATLPGNERLIYQGPRPPYLPETKRLPYPKIDRCSLINVELPEGENEEAFLGWLLHCVGHGEPFMGVPCVKMDALMPEEGSLSREAAGSCAILWDDEFGCDAMAALNFASLTQPENGSVIFGHAGYDADLKRLFPLTLDGDGLTMSAYAAKALDEIADLYKRYGLTPAE